MLNMAGRTDLKMPYGIADFKRIRNEGWYYVDKTEYLAKLEERDSFVFFVRPRRFGKSLFISMMQSYYDGFTSSSTSSRARSSSDWRRSSVAR